MNETLSLDEFEALELINRGFKNKQASACVAKNTKHLYGLKYIAFRRDGVPFITDAGRQALFIKRCIDGLRAITNDPLTKLNGEVQALLEKKGHIKALPAGGFEVTQKGAESLADIDAIK